MGNALTTIMQSALFNLIREEFLISIGRVPILEAIFLNDDGTIASDEEDVIESYDDFEDTALKRYGIMKKKSKSTKGSGTVFCENYFAADLPDISRKESYLRNEFNKPFSAHNIVHAKMLCSNMSYFTKSKDYGYILTEEYRSP
jgi:chloramphenicol O-acetyltransferase